VAQENASELRTRRPIIVGNWKMYKTPAQAQQFVTVFLPMVANHDRDEIVLCPSVTSLPAVIQCAAGSNLANVPTMLNQPEIDGVLVGGASLDPNSFAQIIKY